MSGYLGLVTSEHRNRPRFMATVAAVTDPLCGLQELLETMRAAFDVDSAVGGQLERVGPEEPRGLALDLDPDFACKVRAAICPGLFADVGVVKVRPMRPGVAVPVGLTPCVLALDGERGEECAAVRLAEDRLYVADVEKILEYARQRGIFLRGAQVCYAN